MIVVKRALSRAALTIMPLALAFLPLSPVHAVAEQQEEVVVIDCSEYACFFADAMDVIWNYTSAEYSAQYNRAYDRCDNGNHPEI